VVAEASPYVTLVVVLAGAPAGIAVVVWAYFLLFTGARHASTVRLRVSPRERLAILTLAALILGGGLFPRRACCPATASRWTSCVPARATVLGATRARTPVADAPQWWRAERVGYRAETDRSTIRDDQQISTGR
jgi:hypothetical protein